MPLRLEVVRARLRLPFSFYLATSSKNHSIDGVEGRLAHHEWLH